MSPRACASDLYTLYVMECQKALHVLPIGLTAIAPHLCWVDKCEDRIYEVGFNWLCTALAWRSNIIDI
jgi:hypothetical protein